MIYISLGTNPIIFTSSSHEKIIHKDHSNGKTVENVAGQMDHLKLQAKNTTREKSILQINIR